MPFKHIMVLLNDDDIVDDTTPIKKNVCIHKKQDYLECIKSYPKDYNHFSDKIIKNNCTQLFWNWYYNCRVK